MANNWEKNVFNMSGGDKCNEEKIKQDKGVERNRCVSKGCVCVCVCVCARACAHVCRCGCVCRGSCV